MSREARFKRREVEQARREKMRELMLDYDESVFYPALQSVKDECASTGHGAKNYHNNGLGWVFISCFDCGGMLEKQGPNGEVIKP